MSDVIGEAFVAIRPDMQGFEQQTTSGVKSALGTVAKVAGAAFVGAKIGEGLRDALDAGSDLNETISKTQAVFKEAGPDAVAFGDNAATALLEPKQAALEQLSTLGNLFTSLGLGRRKALDMGKGMVSLAADLGSFNNVPTDEALEAIRSGLVGETEPLRRFGVNMNEATLKAKALELGISDGTSALTPAQKAQAAYALILDQTKNAQGDVARTGGNAAGQQKTLNARMQDLQATIGQKLLPIFNKLLGIGLKIIDWLKEHKTVAYALAGIIGGALVAAFTAWAISASAAAAATLAAAAPVLAIVAAIGLVIAAIVLVWKKWDQIWGFIRDNPVIAVIVGILAAPIAAFVLIIGGLKTLYENWDSIWQAIQQVLEVAWEMVIKPIFEAFVTVGNTIMDGVKWAWDNVGKPVFDAIGTAIGAVKWVVDNILRPVWDGIFDGLKWAWENIAKPALDAIMPVLQPIINAFNILKDLWDSLGSGRGAINDPGGIRAGGSTSVPQGASGGIVTRPTLALIGEAGPEAVVPLNRAPGASPLPGGVWGGGRPIVVNVMTSTPITDRTRFAVEMHQRLSTVAQMAALG